MTEQAGGKHEWMNPNLSEQKFEHADVEYKCHAESKHHAEWLGEGLKSSCTLHSLGNDEVGLRTEWPQITEIGLNLI